MTGSVSNRAVPRVEWGPAITGAFCAIAGAIVLGLFGEAFGAGGLGVLSGIWLVVTPFVATFIGAAIAAAMGDGQDAYPTGIMVWCISVVAGALLIADVGASRMAPGIVRLPANPGALALAGLSAILGLLGAAVGSGVGLAASQSPRVIGARTAPRARAVSSAEVEKEPAVGASRAPPPEGEGRPLPH